MTHSNHSHIRLLETLKSYSSRRRATFQGLERKDSKLRGAILSHLLTTMFIANQLGYNLSWKLSKKMES